MSEGPKWAVYLSIKAQLLWLPQIQFDNESNFIIFDIGWLCFVVGWSYRK